ncbi:MAG: outer membrane protein assembly factor [Burkholderiales bacterium]|nr:outer membrane protein assembly factor [Burkholderiales bacterium]
MRWIWLFWVLWAWVGTVQGQSLAPGEPQAFALTMDAPREVRADLERHLALQRYRAVADLSDSELDRLMAQAIQDSRDLLATLGYFAPDITLERGTPLPDGTRTLTLRVAPGEATLITGLDIVLTGPILQDPAARAQMALIQDTWLLRPGMRFSQDRWAAAKQQALRQLTTAGYPTGRLAESTADIDPQQHSARLGVVLDSGPAYYLGGLVISGLARYDTELVTRLARMQPGSRYAQADLVAAQQRLTDSGFFDSAHVWLNTAGDPAAAPVMVELGEGKLKKRVLGAGVSTDAGARVSLEHTHHQVPGIGWRAVSRVALDRETQSIGAELTARPDEDNWRWVTSGQLQNQETGSAEVTSQRLRLGRNQQEDRTERSIYAQYDRANTTSREGILPVITQALSANFALTLRNFDSIPFPSRGWGLGLEVGGGATLGAQTEPYGRVLTRGLLYLPLQTGRIATRAEVGAVLANEGIDLPSTQLFLTGGDTTVRGYTYRDIGVLRANGAVSPGRYLASGSVEWQRPITVNGAPSSWESALFVDAGAVGDEPAELRPRWGVGAGVRWKSPVGPLQLDLAYGVEVQSLRLHMNVGFSF